MSSTVGQIESAKSGLNAAQMGLQVTRQNISNADTVGYTRQAINQSAIAPDSGAYRFLSTSQKVGQGVSIDSIYQIRNNFLDVRYRQSNSSYSLYDGMKSQLEQVEDIFNEFTTDTTNDKKLTGLSGLLDNLGVSLKEYLNDTSDSTNSSLIQTAVDSLTTSIKTDSKFLNNTFASSDKELSIYINGGAGDSSKGSDVSGIDGIIETIQTLNEQIQSYEITGQKANELRDQRNLLLDKLSTYIDIDSKENKNGMVSVTLQSDADKNDDDSTKKYIITDQNIANEFKKDTNVDATTGQKYTVIRWDKTRDQDGKIRDTGMYEGNIANIQGGVVKSYLNVMNGDGSGVDDPQTGKCGGVGLLYLKQKLNDFATSFAKIMNDQYQANSTSTDKLIKIDAADPSGTIDLTPAFRAVPEKFVDGVATDEENLSTYLQNVYDALYNSEDSTTITSTDGSSKVYKGTFSKFADSFAVEIASTINVLGSKADGFHTSAKNLDDQRKSISSVSINDEGINLIKYQQAYNASSRIITALDQMLDKLINGTGTVGL